MSSIGMTPTVSATVGSRAQGVRRFVFGSLCVALVVGVVASLVANYLSAH
jgi:hypothetical protein